MPQRALTHNAFDCFQFEPFLFVFLTFFNGRSSSGGGAARFLFGLSGLGLGCGGRRIAPCSSAFRLAPVTLGTTTKGRATAAARGFLAIEKC